MESIILPVYGKEPAEEKRMATVMPRLPIVNRRWNDKNRRPLGIINYSE
jgi:hypothetical protein